MPVINVQMLAGRTADQKRALAHALTEAVTAHANVSPDQVWIVFEEVARENWAMAGKLVSDR